MDQQTDLELPDDFFRTDNGQRGEKIAKNFARTSVRGVGVHGVVDMITDPPLSVKPSFAPSPRELQL